MRNLTCLFLWMTGLYLFPSAAAANTDASDCLFSWAERTYPQFFSPAGATSASYEQYYYRFYSGTGNYLATTSANDHVYVLAPAYGTDPIDVGAATDFLGSAGCLASGGAGIAERYPGDANIWRDPDVLFAEMAEEATLAELFANWDSNSTANSVAIDTTTWPANSPGRQSIRLFTTAGPVGAGTVRTAGLYKYFPNNSEGTVFARWYVKYNTTGAFHHSGPRLGGSYPQSSTVPGAIAGTRPNGSDFFSLGAELSQAKTGPTKRSTVDFYNYWMHQRGTSYFPGIYYGNSFINSPEVAINTDEWNCIEVQLTLNDPVSEYTGEIAMWVNGVEVSRVKKGTVGTWTEDTFRPATAGSPFEGFQWRSDRNLKWNYFQLMHFVDNDPVGLVNSVNYDHIVVARKYIGPIH